jgi:hypothetical protein
MALASAPAPTGERVPPGGGCRYPDGAQPPRSITSKASGDMGLAYR